MFDTFVYYGIPIALGLSAALFVAALAGVIVWRLLPEPFEEDEDGVGGSFTCYFCDTFYDIGAEDCLCYGCGRHICLACIDYEESQTPGGPDGPHTASDHPAYERRIR